MTTIVAQIAPQRSTQYADLASTLAPYELQLSPIADQISDIQPVVLGGQPYLQFEMPDIPNEDQVGELGLLSMSSAFFVCYDRLAEIEGPLLRPIDTPAPEGLPREILVSRRYRGKTNEMFTHFLCNVARASSALSRRPWNTLRLLDPLSGGGTTLFCGLHLGASVAGVEHNAKDVESTVTYAQSFMREKGIACQSKRERFKGIGRRWLLNIGKSPVQNCLLAHGKTADTAALISGFRPHLIVGDLPYGIQHKGELVSLLTEALPIWASLLPPSGAMALAWEARHLSREELISLIETVSPLQVLNDPPYNQLAHRVDRVIKERDVVVARPLSNTKA
jgi:hypothetical protein